MFGVNFYRSAFDNLYVYKHILFLDFSPVSYGRVYLPVKEAYIQMMTKEEEKRENGLGWRAKD